MLRVRLPREAAFFRMWTSKRRGVHNTSCPPQLSGARQARDVGGNPCITALAKERERESKQDTSIQHVELAIQEAKLLLAAQGQV